MVKAQEDNFEIKKMSIIKYDWKSGQIFGELMLTGKSFTGDHGHRRVEAICSCGVIKFFVVYKLRNGSTKSCGCKKDISIGVKNTKHGFTKNGEAHPIYTSYSEMIRRCTDENRESYVNYGGRGVTVCDEWFNSFEAFKDWALGNGWEEGLTLDRFPNNENGIYEPSNCRWATDLMQARNTRSNVILQALGESKCISEWAEDSRCAVDAGTLYARINSKKWEHEKAILTPPKSMKIHAFGESKSIGKWLLDERCNIGAHGLRDRLLSGWDAEKAITTKNIKLYGSTD